MKNDFDKPAFPLAGYSHLGLTKREYIATQIYAVMVPEMRGSMVPDDVKAARAIRLTDVLINELSKPNEHA